MNVKLGLIVSLSLPDNYPIAVKFLDESYEKTKINSKILFSRRNKLFKRSAVNIFFANEVADKS